MLKGLETTFKATTLIVGFAVRGILDKSRPGRADLIKAPPTLDGLRIVLADMVTPILLVSFWLV